MGSMDLLNRKIYYGLQGNGNGIPGIGWKIGSLEGKNTYPPKPVSSQRMEVVLRQGDIEWSVECFVTFRKPLDNDTQHPADI